MNTVEGRYLIEVQDLVKHFPVRGSILPRLRSWVRAVDGVSFGLRKGETLGLVGESGCGKTTLGRTILRMLEPTQGSVLFEGLDLLSLQGRARKRMRRDMQIIFQDSDSALDPRMSVGASVEEGLNIHAVVNAAERKETVLDVLQEVGLDRFHMDRLPHELSSGQRQRVVIARALALHPKFIVTDEPLSALDTSIQLQVLSLLRGLQTRYGLAYLFISHDLRVVELISDRVAVMYLGRIVEMAERDQVFANPLHPYTQALLSSVLIPDPRRRRSVIRLAGEVPSPITPPSGCHFHPRCPMAQAECELVDPALCEVAPGHHVACLLVGAQ